MAATQINIDKHLPLTLTYMPLSKQERNGGKAIRKKAENTGVRSRTRLREENSKGSTTRDKTEVID